MSTGMILDGIFASQAIDSSGEILDIDGCDISTLAKDGVINYEHVDGSTKEAKAYGQEIVGKVLYAKKIFSVSDCDTDREEGYWEACKVPFIYGIARLFDGAGHSGAQAIAAIVRDHHANGEKLLVRWSIEGSTLERDKDQPNRLAVSVARRVAATLKPCNRTAISGLISDPRAPEGFDKQPETDRHVTRLIGGNVEKSERLEHPLYTRLGGVHELESNPLIDEDTQARLKAVAKDAMLKALEAGSYNVAPSSLVQGAALQREDRGLKARAMAAVRDYGKKRFDKAEFRSFAKTYLPEADDNFLDHFTDVAEDYHMKRGALKKKEGDEPAKSKKTIAPKKAVKPKKVKAPEPESFEEPDNLLSDDVPAAGADDFDFSSMPAAKIKKPKKLKPEDIAPAQGDDLKAALEEATNMSGGKFMGLSPIQRHGIELKGKALASYLGIPEPKPQQLTVRGKAAMPPQASSHIDITTCKHSIYEGHGKGCKTVSYTADEPHYNFDTGYLNVPARPGTFNMKTGQWNTGHTGGYFKHYIPGHYDPAMHGPDPIEGQKQADKEKADFNQLLEDGERSKYHDNAMSNWVLTHKLMRQGKTPDEVVAYKTAFSMLSPNTPVPVHEMMFSYLADSMKHTGIDLRDPRFAGARGHLLSEDLKEGRATGKRPDVNDPQKYGIYGDWKSRDTGNPNKLPEHAPEHSQRTLHNITTKNAVKPDPAKGIVGRKAGQLMSFMLAQNKFVNMAKYHKYHDALVNVFRKHGPSDLGDQTIVNELMHHKEAAGKFESAKARAVKAGKKDFEYGGQTHSTKAEYPHGVVVGGLAPKTSRLTVTMAGGGSMHVPDTHMNRFNFGMEKGHGSDDEDDEDVTEAEPTEEGSVTRGPMDNKSIASIKKVLWEERNHNILNQMDRYYEKHSPAVDHMVDRWGHWLEGETPQEKRRHAVFGGFWKNWSAIVDHEKSRGMWSNGRNDYSDHRPSWAATLPHTLDKFPVTPFLVMPKLKKGEEGYDESLPLRAAMLHHAWIAKYGEMGAAHLAMCHLIPQLLAAHAIRHVGEDMRKAEALSIDVKKALSEVHNVTPTEPGEQTVMFAGQPVVAGHAITTKGELALLHEDKDHFVAVPKENAQDWCHHHLMKLPKAQQGTHFTVTRRPAVHVSDLEN